MGSDAENCKKKENGYYKIVRGARISKTNENLTARLQRRSVARITSGSSTLSRRPASTWIGLSFCTSSLLLVDDVEYLIGFQDFFRGDVGQFPRIMGSDNLFGIEVFLHVTKNFLESIERAALESIPCFSACENESVCVVIERKSHDLPRAKSAVICLLMTCSM